jgi:amidohydrolase
MKMKIVARVLSLVVGVCLTVSGASAQELLEETVRRELSSLMDTYTYLHSHPELSYFEEETSAFLATELRDLGFTVTERVGDYGVEGRNSYGVVAVLENGEGPTVLIRTDTDALPVTENTGATYASTVTSPDETGVEVGVMHACGHDVHMTSFLGTARMLSSMKDRWRGTVVMIGQPAEERGAGARSMLAGGLFEDFPKPDFGLALHVHAAVEAGKIGFASGYHMASVDSVDITVRGRGGHGAYPHTTIDPVVIAARIVTALQTLVSREVSPLESAVVTVGSIHGGSKHNIIPDDVRMQLTVRSYEPAVRRQVLDGIRRVARGVALSAGVPPELEPIVQIAEEEFTPASYNDPELVERVVRVFNDTLGEERVVEVQPVMGGEDFSRYGMQVHEVPIFMFRVGAVDPAKYREYQDAGRPLPSLHSSEFLPVAEPAIRTGITAMTSAVLELLKK